MVGIEFPGYIQFNYDYKETNSLYGDYRYFLGDVYISLYDTRTNIKSGNLSIIHVSQTYDDGYHSRPLWDCTYQNEQNILKTRFGFTDIDIKQLYFILETEKYR